MADNRTELYWAAFQNRIDEIRELLASGVNVNEPSGNGRIALHMVAYSDGEAAKMLLEAGTKINIEDERGISPLLYAARCGLKDSVTLKMLLAAGADITQKMIHTLKSEGWSDIPAYLQSILDGTTSRPTPEEVGLDMAKRNAALAKLAQAPTPKPVLGKYTNAAEHQRQAALDDPEQGI